jgi:hypothetical protein
MSCGTSTTLQLLAGVSGYESAAQAGTSAPRLALAKLTHAALGLQPCAGMRPNQQPAPEPPPGKNCQISQLKSAQHSASQSAAVFAEAPLASPSHCCPVKLLLNGELHGEAGTPRWKRHPRSRETDAPAALVTRRRRAAIMGR